MASGQVARDSGWTWLISLGNAVGFFSLTGIFYCFGVFYPEVMKEFDVKYAQVYLVSGLCTGMMSLGAFFLVFVKWFGIRRLAMVSSFFFSVSLLAASQSTNITYFILFCGAAAGFFSGITINVMFFSVTVYYDKHRAKAAGIATAGISVGVLVAAPLLSALIEEYGWRGAMLITSGISLNACVGMALYRPVVMEQVSHISKCDVYKNYEDEQPRKRKCTDRLTAIFDYTLFTRPEYILVYASSMSFYCAKFGTTFLIVPLAMESLGLERSDGSILLSVYYGGELFGKLLSGLIADCKRINWPLFLGIASFLGTLATFGMTLCGTFTAASVMAFVIGMTYAPYGGLYALLHPEVFEYKQIKNAISYDGCMSTILTLPVLYVLGVLIDATGDVRVPFYVCGLFICICATSLIGIYVLLQRRDSTRALGPEPEQRAGAPEQCILSGDRAGGESLDKIQVDPDPELDPVV